MMSKNNSTSNFSNSCTLVVPGLLKLPLQEYFSEGHGLCCEDQLQPKELELFLAKSKQQAQTATEFEEVLIELFNQTTSADQPYPIASVCYLSDANTVGSNNPTSWCLRADPVQLTPDRDELVLSGPEVFSLSLTEAEHLVMDLNVLFEEDGWRLEAKTATRWYLHLPEDPQITTSDLSQVRDQSIGEFLPAGPGKKQWHRIMNEVQMVLHASNINSERQSNGQIPVSSLWFWGGGKLPEFGHSDWSQVWSNEVLSLGLAKITHTPCLSVPKNSKAWLEQVETPQNLKKY